MWEEIVLEWVMEGVGDVVTGGLTMGSRIGISRA